MPSGDFTRPTAPRKRTVNKGKAKAVAPPIPDIQTGTGYKAPKPAPAPKASWTQPIGRVNVAPPKPRSPVQSLPPDLRPSRRRHEATKRQLEERAAGRRAEEVLGAGKRDVGAYLGLAPPRTVRSVGFAPSPPMYIGPPVAGPPAPLRYNGKIITPQQTQRDMFKVLSPRVPQAQRLKALERLHIVGISDQYGSKTRGEKVREDRAALAAARRAFLKRYRQIDKDAHGVAGLANLATSVAGVDKTRGLSDEEVLRRIEGWSAGDIYKTMDAHQTRASGQLLGKAQSQLMGFDPRGFITATMGALETGRDVIQEVAGNNLPANLLADALYLPMGLVGGAAMAASDPAAAWAGIRDGYIGSKIQGKDKQAAQVARDHPLFTFLELYGAKAAAGRGAGAVARGVSGGRVAGLRRDPVALINQEGTGALFERHYSKDVINRAAQKLYDRMLKDGPEVVLRGETVRSKRLTADRPVIGRAGKKRRSVGGEVETHLINRYMDNVASRVNSLNRLDRDTNAQFARMNAPVRQHRGGRVGQRLGEAIDRTLPSQPSSRRGDALAERFPGLYRPERDTVTHVLRGLVQTITDREGRPPSAQTFRRDLTNEQQRLIRATQKPDATPDRVEQALDQVALIQRVLDTPRAWQNFQGVIDSARAVGGRLREQEGINQKLGLDPDAAERSPLFEFAQTEGAVYGSGPFDRAQAAAVAARKAARSKESEERRLRWDEEHTRGGAEVEVARRNREIRSQDQELSDAVAARGVAQRELTKANMNVRNVGANGGDMRAAIRRQTAAREKMAAAKADYSTKLASFEQRVAKAVAKKQQGKKLSRTEARLVRYDRQPPGRLASLENVRGKRSAAQAELKALKAKADELHRIAANTAKVQLHKPDGTPLSNAEIRAAMREKGVDPEQIAYLTNTDNSLGSRAYYAPFDGTSRQNLNSQQAKTGSMFEQGGHEYRYNHIIEQMVSHGTKAINAQQLDSFINEIAVTGPKTKDNPDGYLTSEQFRALQKTAEWRGRPLTPVVARQQRLSDESLAALKETQNVAEATPGMGLLEAMWDARITEGAAATKKNNLVAVPDEFLARLKAHIEVNGGGNLGGRGLSSAFRKTVLPLSSKWLTGNVVEAIYRGIVIAGAVPLWDNRVAHRAWVEMLKADIRELGWEKGVAALDRYGAATGRKERRAALRDMERFAPNARAAKSELIGGMFFGNRGLTNKGRNTTPEGIGQAIANSSAGRALNGTIDKINTPSFAFNRRFEQMMQNMVLGKHLRREMEEFQGSWVKAMRAQEDVLAKASKGLLDTSGMVRAGKYLDETLGRYGRFSPRVRRLVQNGLPFLPWFLNSARFTFVTLPMKHPVKVALMARVEAAFQDEWEEQHKDLSPDQRKGSLSGEYRRDDGSFTQFGRYLPTGLWAGVAAGDLGELGAPVLPQFSSILKALGGQDPFGSPLRIPGDDGKLRDLTTMEQIQYILNTGAETFTPLLGLARRLQEQGQTSLPTSTVFSPRTKPSSHPMEPGVGAALDKVFNPGRGVYLRDAKKGKTYKSLDDLYDALESEAADPGEELDRKLERLYDEAGL